MLTSDLIRVRRRGNELHPSYVKGNKPALWEKAENLIATFQEHVGETRERLEEAISISIGESTDYLLQRGLVKLLYERSEFEVACPVEPKELRKRIFALSAEHYPVALEKDLLYPVSREDILQQVADEFEIPLQQVKGGFYADLQSAQELTSFESLRTGDLIQRYNLALAQSVLYKASSLWIELYTPDAKRLKQLLRYVKFFQLIAKVESKKYGFLIKIDGPMSLFQKSQKYGFQMASFLPALVLCEDWSLEAEVLWETNKKPFRFTLKANDGLVSHYPDKGVYRTKEEQYFCERWNPTKLHWGLQEKVDVLQLGPKDIAVTDYAVTNEQNQSVFLEMLGFWSLETLQKKIKLVEEYREKPVLLVVSEKLKGSKGKKLPSSDHVYFYKDVIIPKKVIEKAEGLLSMTNTLF